MTDATSPHAEDMTANSAKIKDVKALEHIVVIMFENRSFDNIFGYLYDSPILPNGQKFDGLAGRNDCNVGPDKKKIYAGVYKSGYDAAIKSPDPDPGEEYQHVNTQLYAEIIPAENANLPAQQMLPPYNAPKYGSVNMGGFAIDYFYNILRSTGDKEIALEKYTQIMGSFDGSMLPVLHTLAKNFAVYDHWHSAVPSQTFCNRAFFHASTSSGFVTNDGGRGLDKWVYDNPVPTIFNRLEEKGISWAIYYDASQDMSITHLINSYALDSYWKASRGPNPVEAKRFRTMTEFYQDVENGNLPAYAFIEPRQLYAHNDMHPPLTFNFMHKPVGTVYDMRWGEELLSKVYMAIRNSASAKGSNAMNTTLLVTFDEHGGTYDHVAPPSAIPPSQSQGTTECDFKFNRLGVRVPTIAISAYTQAGTVISDQMHHGALVSTLCGRYGLNALTDRDRSAPDIGNAFTLTSPRPASTWPVTEPHPVAAEPPTGPFTEEMADTLLTAPARSMIGLYAKKYGEAGEALPQTYGEAHALIERVKAGTAG